MLPITHSLCSRRPAEWATLFLLFNLSWGYGLAPVYAQSTDHHEGDSALTAPLTPITAPLITSPDAFEGLYILGPGDQLQMDVFNLPDYSRDYQILADGTLSLPLLGTVAVAGMTLEQATAAITQRYGQFIRQPAITLLLLEARPLQIAIAGEVKRPGAYTVRADNTLQTGMTTVTQAIQLAGGITQTANIRQIQVSRPFPNRAVPPQVRTIDLWELLQSGNLSQDISLRDGDTLLIPTASALDPSEASTLATASFAPDVMTVYVVGEVVEPGAVEVSPNTPLHQAILAAGGFNNRAAQNSVELIRLNPNGTVAQRNIEIDFSQGIGNEQNPILREFDTVVVRRSNLTQTTDFLDVVLSPALTILRIFNDL